MDSTYTVALAKGQGMPSETILLLKAWQEGMSALELKRHVIANGLLPKATNYRTSDIVSRVFAPRYLSNGATAAKNLKYLLALSVPADRLLQLFLIYTARANLILRDFITTVYWAHYNAGSRVLQRQDALNFMTSARAGGHMPKNWSDAMKTKMTRYLLSALTDFKLTAGYARGPARNRPVQHPTDHDPLPRARSTLFRAERSRCA